MIIFHLCLISYRYGVASTYYGISFNIAGFGVNIYLTQFIYAAVEFPAKVAVYYFLDKIGRRKTETGALFLAGLCLAITVVIPRGKSLDVVPDTIPASQHIASGAWKEGV